LRSPFQAVVFDLDGTVIDTAPDLHAHLNAMLGELGRPLLEIEEIRPMIGDGARMLLKRGLEASGGLPDGKDLEMLFAEFLERYTAEPARLGAVYEGVVEALEELAAEGVRLGMCTNKPQAATERLLTAMGLERYFLVVLGGDALPVKKPDAGHIRGVLDRLGADGHAVMVGDSQNDLLAARATGLPCILVSFGYTQIPARELGADLVIDRMSELADALRTLAAARPPPPSPSPVEGEE
jgi:phosphoglycolate phosphatase